MLQGCQPIIYGDGQPALLQLRRRRRACSSRWRSTRCVGQIINIGPDEGTVTILELVETIAELLSFPLDPIFVPERPGEIDTATCSADKARRLLGYETTTSLREGLAEMIDWISRRGPQDFVYDLDLEILTDATPRTWVDKLM